MQNNQIFIGIVFNLPRNAAESALPPRMHILDLYVVRDITLKQLFEGIYYGLQKQESRSSGEQKDIYVQCIDLFNKCIKPLQDGKSNQYIHLANYDPDQFKQYFPESVFDLNDEICAQKLCDLGFITSTELYFSSSVNQYNNPQITEHIILPFQPNQDHQIHFPEYNISTRERHQFNKEPLVIIPPSDPPQLPEDNMMAAMLPSMLSMMIMALARSGHQGFDPYMLVMVLLMASSSVVSGLFMNHNRKAAYNKNLNTWRKDYETYINDTIEQINLRQQMDTRDLKKWYPDPNELAALINTRNSIFGMNENVFSRSPGDDDFLTVRLGISDFVDSIFPIQFDNKNEIVSHASYVMEECESNLTHPYQVRIVSNDELLKTKLMDYTKRSNRLSQLSAKIEERQHFLKDAPLLYSFKNVQALGIVDPGSESGISPISFYLITRFIFDLCYYQSPEDLQFIIFFDPTTDSDLIDHLTYPFKYLAHFHGLFSDKSQFAFNQESASSIMASLMNIMETRKPQKSDGDASAKPTQNKAAHIMLIILYEYGLKEHAFAQYLPHAPEAQQEIKNDLGLTFVYATQYKEYLPPYCNDVIRVNDKYLTITPRENQGNAKSFRIPTFDETEPAQIYNSSSLLYDKAFHFFSSIYYAKMAQNGKVPSAVTMFELMDTTSDTVQDLIRRNWSVDSKGSSSTQDVTRSLKVALGKNENGITYLDLHEKYDGPHMLVAGTTGSGKSETIISLLLGLCMQFRPTEVNLLLVDMKGGGFTQRLGMLPHVVGTVTDVDGDENGTGAVYMLHRFLDAMTSEIKRRKILFNKMKVDNIDDYISACRNIDQHIHHKHVPEEEQEELRNMAKYDQLSHLILVVDEFTELKRFSTENSDVDFIKQITTIARVGRSLGYHICLISQNIQGAITEDISVNSKSRLCLKVATNQASKEMIGNELAAAPEMPGMGRAYLLVGTGSKFEYFQSAYTGANASDATNHASVNITLADQTGPYQEFYNSKRDNQKLKKERDALAQKGELHTQLEVITDSIVKVYSENESWLPHPHIVFQPPLGKKLILDTNGHVYDDKGCPVPIYTLERDV